MPYIQAYQTYSTMSSQTLALKIELLRWLSTIENYETLEALAAWREKQAVQRHKKLQLLLLAAPTYEEDDLQTFEENRKWMNTWKG